jgi:hypothetical protein
MSSVQRGKLRDVETYVQVSATQEVYYGFFTKDLSAIAGISAADVTALGHLTPAGVAAISGAITFFGANAPKPAKFKKVLNRRPGAGVQGSVTTFGDGTTTASVLAAAGAGFKKIKDIRPCTFRNDARAVTVGIKLSGTTGIYIQTINAADVTAYATELGLMLPGSLTASERERCFRGSNTNRPAKVQKVVNNATVTMPVSSDKLSDAIDAGWSLVG